MISEPQESLTPLEKFANDLTLSVLNAKLCNSTHPLHNRVLVFFKENEYKNTRELDKLSKPSEGDHCFFLSQKEIVAFFKNKSKSDLYKKLFNGITNQETLESFGKLIKFGFSSQNIISLIKFQNKDDFEERLNKLKDGSTLQLFQELNDLGFTPNSIHKILDQTNSHFGKAIDQLKSFKDSESYKKLGELGFTTKHIEKFLHRSRSHIIRNLEELQKKTTLDLFEHLISTDKLSAKQVLDYFKEKTLGKTLFAPIAENSHRASGSEDEMFLGLNISQARTFLSNYTQEQGQPVQEQGEPVQEQRQQAQAQRQQAQAQRQPVQEQGEPVQEQRQQAQAQRQPVQEQGQPVQEQRQPVQEQGEPAQKQVKLAELQIRASRLHKLIAERQIKEAEEQIKVAEEQIKVAKLQIFLSKEQVFLASSQIKAAEEQIKLAQIQEQSQQRPEEPQNQLSQNGGAPGSVVDISRNRGEKRKLDMMSIENILNSNV